MMGKFLICCFFFAPLVAFGQIGAKNLRTIKAAVSDSVEIDSVSINSAYFSVETLDGILIDSSKYHVNFAKARLYLNNNVMDLGDSISVTYLPYPEFLTKKYSQFREDIIIEDTKNLNKLYQLEQESEVNTFIPFEGLNTNGSISRGITTGNNQNTVLDSELDLQISGKISEGVNLRASIQDSNIPIQQSGYSQNLDEFDQVFIELYGENWNVRAGDIDLEQDDSYFASFTKKVQGLSLGGTLTPNDNKLTLFAAGALVRGIFAKSEFLGQEGNQGPYKLIGPNGELFVLIVAGSERVFVNGIQLERGENKDYVIDYNAGEIVFNATYPITSEMRIVVEYQYSDRNFARLVATGGGEFQGEKFQIGAFVYSENDLKNQPLQQNLSAEQVAVLQAAGDDETQMVAPSAVSESFDENKVLYEKQVLNGIEIFVYSTDQTADLYQVKFSLVGENQGDYILSDLTTLAKVYEYVVPVNGVRQGNYAPITQLFAPTKLQMAVVHGNYRPSENTNIDFEFAGSKHDINLFSNLDDSNNNGFAGRLELIQNLAQQKNWKLNLFSNVNYIHQNFQSVERIYEVEFDRNWNLRNPIGNQTYLDAGIEFSSPKIGIARYHFQQLDFSKNFNGLRHVIETGIHLDSLKISASVSYLNSKSKTINSEFLRLYAKSMYSFENAWAGVRFSLENNQQILNETKQFTAESQAFKNYEVFSGIGDSTKVYLEIGYRHRVNDSLRFNKLMQVSRSNDYYLHSQVLHSENSNLSFFADYRTLNSKAENETSRALNSRLLYNQFLFDRIVLLNTSFETKSGTVPQQEFTYLEVDPGQGEYTWIDYNENGIQELEEFEIAPFPDQATFVRVLLPNQLFIKTHQNKFSQILTVNFQDWNLEENTFKKFLSHFYNQTSFLIDRKVRNNGDNFVINPFHSEGSNDLALISNFRNTLFFNRGKQHFTTSYSFVSTKAKNLLSIGLLSNTLKSHQMEFTHRLQESWLLNLKNQLDQSLSSSENFPARNYRIEGYFFKPKIAYLFSDRAQLSVFYKYGEQKNSLGEQEVLLQQKLGASCSIANAQKYSFSADFNFIINDFEGNPFSPTAYQMLQGLQPEKNYTWSFLAQKKLTEYLDLNFSYFGRKSENSKTIHTGSVQLRAYF